MCLLAKLCPKTPANGQLLGEPGLAGRPLISVRILTLIVGDF